MKKRPRTPEHLRDSCISWYEFKKRGDEIRPMIRGLKVPIKRNVRMRDARQETKKKVTFGKNKFPVTKKPSSYPVFTVPPVNRDFSLAFFSFRASAAGRLQAVGLLVGCSYPVSCRHFEDGTVRYGWCGNLFDSREK